jgi:hypothetical protein
MKEKPHVILTEMKGKGPMGSNADSSGSAVNYIWNIKSSPLGYNAVCCE